jgi:hypothetical protein
LPNLQTLNQKQKNLLNGAKGKKREVGKKTGAMLDCPCPMCSRMKILGYCALWTRWSWLILLLIEPTHSKILICNSFLNIILGGLYERDWHYVVLGQFSSVHNGTGEYLSRIIV